MAIASAWEAGWFILAGHPEVFRNKVGGNNDFPLYIFKKKHNKMDASFALLCVESKDVKICSQIERCRGMFQHGAVSMENDKFPR